MKKFTPECHNQRSQNPNDLIVVKVLRECEKIKVEYQQRLVGILHLEGDLWLCPNLTNRHIYMLYPRFKIPREYTICTSAKNTIHDPPAHILAMTESFILIGIESPYLYGYVSLYEYLIYIDHLGWDAIEEYWLSMKITEYHKATGTIHGNLTPWNVWISANPNKQILVIGQYHRHTGSSSISFDVDKYMSLEIKNLLGMCKDIYEKIGMYQKRSTAVQQIARIYRPL